MTPLQEQLSDQNMVSRRRCPVLPPDGSPTRARTWDLRITRAPCFRKDVDYAFAVDLRAFRRAPSSLYTFRPLRGGLARRCLGPCGR